MEYKDKYRKVDHLISKLHDTTLSLKERRGILDYIRRHLSHHFSDGLPFIEAGALTPIFDLLSTLIVEGKGTSQGNLIDSVELNKTVAVAVALLLHLTTVKSHDAELQKDTSLRILLTLMGNKYSDSIRSRSCRSLGNILQGMTSPIIQTSMQKVSKEMAKTMVEMFDSPTLHEVALRMVRQATTYFSGLKRHLVRANLFKTALIPLLANDNQPTLLQNTLMCMSTFAMDSADTTSDISADIALHLAPHLRRLVQLASDETPGVQQSAIDLLCRLACNNQVLRNEMGSKGVISCFIEHLSFDDRQTTVSSVQKKIVYALTLCCRDGFNRARLSDIGGMRVLMAVLGSNLYRPVHLHILNCLTEFRHDEVTLGQMVLSYGAVGHAARYLSTALEVLYPPTQATESVKSMGTMDTSPEAPSSIEGDKTASESISVSTTESSLSTPGSSQTKVAFIPRRFSARSPSYQHVVQESESRRQYDYSSPAFSPPTIDDDLRHVLQSSSCVSPQFSATTCSSPASLNSTSPFQLAMRLEEDAYSGRYSPVMIQDEEPVITSGVSCKRKLDMDVDTAPSSKRSCLVGQSRPVLSQDDAKKCLQYVVSFFEAVSYRKNLVPALATSNVIFALVKYMEKVANFKAVFQILLRIVKEPVCFESLVKIGLPLVLQDTARPLESSNSNTVKAKKEALSHLRANAGGEFGFGEMLHLSLTSSQQIRMNCIAGASVLIQNRADRIRFFKKKQVLDQVMDGLLDFSLGAQHRQMLAQALHAFFLDEVFPEEVKTFPVLTSGDSKSSATSCCLEKSTSNAKMDVEDDEAIFLLDDGLRIAASRSFLSANSEVFAAMLGRSFLESQTPAIAIRDTPTSAFYAIVHFFSGCHVQTCPQLKGVFENADDLLDLVQLADQFLAFELKTFACDTLVEQRMEAGNVKQLYEASQWLQLSFVGEKMLERILKWPTMGVSVRASLLDNLLQSECALMAVNYIRVLLETCM